jgi:hypothetical protein
MKTPGVGLGITVALGVTAGAVGRLTMRVGAGGAVARMGVTLGNRASGGSWAGLGARPHALRLSMANRMSMFMRLPMNTL